MNDKSRNELAAIIAERMAKDQRTAYSSANEEALEIIKKMASEHAAEREAEELHRLGAKGVLLKRFGVGLLGLLAFLLSTVPLWAFGQLAAERVCFEHGWWVVFLQGILDCTGRFGS